MMCAAPGPAGSAVGTDADPGRAGPWTAAPPGCRTSTAAATTAPHPVPWTSHPPLGETVLFSQGCSTSETTLRKPSTPAAWLRAVRRAAPTRRVLSSHTTWRGPAAMYVLCTALQRDGSELKRGLDVFGHANKGGRGGGEGRLQKESFCLIRRLAYTGCPP